MKHLLTWLPLSALCGQLILAAESGDADHEVKLVEQGVLGVVNVLRELDSNSFTNRVIVSSNVEGLHGSRPEDTIDGSGKLFQPKVGPSEPVALTYHLPGPRTVSSVVISFLYGGMLDAPGSVRLERSTDGGQTWVKVFDSSARKSTFRKVFPPVEASALRLTLEGDGSDKAARRTREVSIYADPEAMPARAASQRGGLFNFLRAAWYAGEIQQHRSPDTAVWTRPFGGKSFPHVPFGSEIADGHDGAWGGSEKNEPGRRVFLRLDLAQARRMDFGVIGSGPDGKTNQYVLAATSRAEFYTAQGALDPGVLTDAGTEAIVKQGWVLQQAWHNDTNACKTFRLARPGQYNQMLLVWDGLGLHPMPQNWARLEMFSAEEKNK